MFIIIYLRPNILSNLLPLVAYWKDSIIITNIFIYDFFQEYHAF